MAYPEEGPSGSRLDTAVLDLGLFGQVLRRLYGGLHPLHGQEGRQVGGVGGYHYQGEEPPDPGHHPGRNRPDGRKTASQTENTELIGYLYGIRIQCRI